MLQKEGVEIGPYNFIKKAKKQKLYPNIIKNHHSRLI